MRGVTISGRHAFVGFLLLSACGDASEAPFFGAGGSASSVAATGSNVASSSASTGGGGGSASEVVCLVSNRESWELGGGNCKAGTVLEMGSAQFSCSQPLSSYGALPIKVVWDFVADTNPNWNDQGPLDLLAGCMGDDDPDTIDLIAYIPGDGKTFGSSGGAAKFRAPPGPTNLQVTGVFQCGPLAPQSQAHQDVWQFQGGNADANLAIVNGVSGDWDAGTATCIGAGGAIFWSTTNDIDILGGRYVTCNHGFLGVNQGASGNVVDGAGFRTGRVEAVANGGDARCFDYAASNPCLGTADFSFGNVVCESWDPGSDTWEAVSPN